MPSLLVVFFGRWLGGEGGAVFVGCLFSIELSGINSKGLNKSEKEATSIATQESTPVT